MPPRGPQTGLSKTDISRTSSRIGCRAAAFGGPSLCKGSPFRPISRYFKSILRHFKFVSFHLQGREVRHERLRDRGEAREPGRARRRAPHGPVLRAGAHGACGARRLRLAEGRRWRPGGRERVESRVEALARALSRRAQRLKKRVKSRAMA